MYEGDSEKTAEGLIGLGLEGGLHLLEHHVPVVGQALMLCKIMLGLTKASQTAIDDDDPSPRARRPSRHAPSAPFTGRISHGFPTGALLA
jgi:hypothetical protein